MNDERNNKPRPKREYFHWDIPVSHKPRFCHDEPSVAFVCLIYVQEKARSMRKIITDHAAATPYAPSLKATS
jgi:hypothetical protein